MSEVPEVIAGYFMHQGTKSTQEDGACLELDFTKTVLVVAEENGLDAAHFDATVKRIFACLLDGHAGATCMEFVRDNICREVCLEFLRRKEGWCVAMEHAVLTLEARWTKSVIRSSPNDKSGTTVTIAIVQGTDLFCTWTGDSPCWLQMVDGSVVEVSTQHRPTTESEMRRVSLAGGELRCKTVEGSGFWCFKPIRKTGPLRVFPSGLNITRSIGDTKFKVPDLGGQPGIVIPDPESRHVVLNRSVRFVLLATDGLSDNLDKGLHKFSKSLEKTVQKSLKNEEFHMVATLAAEDAVFYGLKRAKSKLCRDNTSCMVMCFLDKNCGSIVLRHQQHDQLVLW